MFLHRAFKPHGKTAWHRNGMSALSHFGHEGIKEVGQRLTRIERQ